MRPGAGNAAPPAARHDVIIIGAGASGLFCAAECGRRGRRVLVLDHAKRAAGKVLISGGGRCNFTNLAVSHEHYLSRNPQFCRSALARFTPHDLLERLKKHRIRHQEKEAGQLFCATGARDIAAMLEQECAAGGAEVLLGCRITGVERKDGFLVRTEEGTFSATSLVIATGGLSYPKLGATSFGLDLAGQFGLAVVPPAPALVPFLFTASDRRRYVELAGVSVPCVVRCGTGRHAGNILFTHRGLSGPAALQASLSWETGVALSIDLLPGQDAMALFREKRQSRMTLGNFLAGLLPKRFALAWCDGVLRDRQLAQCSDRDLRAVAERLHGWEVRPAGTEGYDTAEVTRGGVDTTELSSRTMEAAKVPGLYFIGEVVDVTGELGGYNLHWAWASGWAAGQHA